MPHRGRVTHTRKRTARADNNSSSSQRTNNCAFALDFYGQQNDKWIAHTVLPPTETRVTQAYYIREAIVRELRQTIDRATSGEPSGPISQLLTSWDVAAAQSIPHGISALLHLMTSMDSQEDIAARLGFMNRNGIPAPLSVYVNGDPRDQRRCRIYIEEGEPRIGIPEYWNWPEYATHRRAYHVYVRRLARVLRMPHLAEGWSAEREFASVFPTAMERRKRLDMLTWSELTERYSGMDWRALFRAWGLRDEQMTALKYNVTSSGFLHHMSARVKAWPIQRWRAWFALLIAQWAAGLTPHGPLRAAWFSYARHYLQGMLEDESPSQLRYAIVRALMPNTLGRLWVREHCSADLKRQITAIIANVRDAAEHQLANTSWMAPSTRAAAVRKLRAMDIQVCWPDKWPTHEIVCGMDNTDYMENLLRIWATATDSNLALITKGDCRHPMGTGWGRPVFDVNAFYYPNENRFLLPAAILRPPFYDPKQSVAWNYGAIGATIGHELCHAFDAEGREYDADGNRRSWWTERDDKEYRARASRVVRLYESRDYRGEVVDGSLTLVENIADLGGLEFALAGAKRAVGRELTRQELRDFFDSFAVSWRAKDRMARAKELLATDPHAPPKLRVNHAVRQLDAWYTAYDVDPSCPDYIPPAQRIRFFA